MINWIKKYLKLFHSIPFIKILKTDVNNIQFFFFFSFYIIALTEDRISSIVNLQSIRGFNEVHMTTRWIKQSAESKCIRLIEKFQCDTIRGLGDVLYLLHAAFIGNCFTDILNIVIPVYGQANLVQKRTHCTGLQRLFFPPFPSPLPPPSFHIGLVCTIKHTRCSHF